MLYHSGHTAWWREAEYWALESDTSVLRHLVRAPAKEIVQAESRGSRETDKKGAAVVPVTEIEQSECTGILESKWEPDVVPVETIP
jgi:hypothetical protein